MSVGTSVIERDQRERGIVVDNAFRPGKGSRPRPYSISKSEYERRYRAIFGHTSPKGKQRTRRAKGGAK